MNDCEIIERMTQLEAERFSVNDYRGLDDAPAFSIACGDVPLDNAKNNQVVSCKPATHDVSNMREIAKNNQVVICNPIASCTCMPLVISAPHAVSQMREGRVKPSDDFTGALAIVVAELLGCFSMVASRYDGRDYNWDPFECCSYKQALAELVRDNGIVAVIDVHGVPSASPYAIEVGSADGVSVRAMPGADKRALASLRHDLAPFLDKHGKEVALNEAHGARGRNTVTSAIARECGIAALQLEIATPFRVPADIGGHTPAGEQIPFTSAQLPKEIASRRNPDPACVAATVRAIAHLGELLLPTL